MKKEIFKFQESNFMATFLQNISDSEIEISVGDIEPLVKSIFEALAKTLKINANKETPKVIVFKDLKEEPAFISKLEYFEEKDSDEEDKNWSLTFSFNKEDMENCDIVPSSIESGFCSILIDCLNKNDIILTEEGGSIVYLIKIVPVVMTSIKDYLDINMTEEHESISLVLDDVFEATCSIEDEQKVFSITPGGIIKEIIKDDKGLND